MKFYICPDDPDVIAMAENIDEAKTNICGSCKFKCNGPKEVASSEIPMIRESNNFLINIGNYIHEMKGFIMELIAAIDSSTLCKECCDKGIACSDCPWFKAKSRAFELMKEVE